MPQLAVFPKGFLPRLQDGRMSLAEWLELAATLDVDGVELYSPFLERTDGPYLRALAERIASLGLRMPMLCHTKRLFDRAMRSPTLIWKSPPSWTWWVVVE